MDNVLQNQSWNSPLNERPTQRSKRDLDCAVDTVSAQQQEKARIRSVGWGAVVKLSQVGMNSSTIVRARCLRVEARGASR